ncbi:hypothetical protein [Billgrantia saliphila]|uniref:hypothetical protein n=1 Tax=Billgrantia saliphila TaxID=1848458 RepID=UPI003BEEC00A
MEPCPVPLSRGWRAAQFIGLSLTFTIVPSTVRRRRPFSMRCANASRRWPRAPSVKNSAWRVLSEP